MATLINDPYVGRVVTEIINEADRATKIHPNYPTDPVRRAAIMVEEAGEVIQAALDLTRNSDHPHRDLSNARTRMRAESVQCAAMNLKLILAMDHEDDEAVINALAKGLK